MLNCTKLFKVTLNVGLLLCIVGCAFQMRGAISVPDYLKTVHITPDEPYDAFQRELRYRLTRNNVNIVANPGPNTTILEVSKPEIKEEVLANNSSGQGQRFKLLYIVNYKLTTSDKENTRELRYITRSREITKTNNRMLSSENEQQLVQKELLIETVTELLRQLTTRPLHKASVADSSTIDDSLC